MFMSEYTYIGDIASPNVQDSVTYQQKKICSGG